MDINEFLSAFAEQFEDTNPEEIREDTVFHDLDEWDSLVALAVLNVSEKRFGKRISFDEMKSCVTVTDLYNLVASK